MSLNIIEDLPKNGGVIKISGPSCSGKTTLVRDLYRNYLTKQCSNNGIVFVNGMVDNYSDIINKAWLYSALNLETIGKFIDLCNKIRSKRFIILDDVITHFDDPIIIKLLSVAKEYNIFVIISTQNLFIKSLKYIDVSFILHYSYMNEINYEGPFSYIKFHELYEMYTHERSALVLIKPKIIEDDDETRGYIVRHYTGTVM